VLALADIVGCDLNRNTIIMLIIEGRCWLARNLCSFGKEREEKMKNILFDRGIIDEIVFHLFFGFQSLKSDSFLSFFRHLLI
jgi:hypothetical protein